MSDPSAPREVKVPDPVSIITRIPLPSDLLNDQGIQGTHDVRYGQLSPPLAPKLVEQDGMGNGDVPGSEPVPEEMKAQLKAKKSKTQLNATAPVFVPMTAAPQHGEDKSRVLSPASQRLAQNHAMAHAMALEDSAAQRQTENQMYPTIQYYPAIQHNPALPYALPDCAVPPYIAHQYLTPQYGVQFAPSTPPQMISMFSTPQQAMEFQQYLADRARANVQNEHQYSHPKSSPGKGPRKRMYQKRRKESRQFASEETEYFGYYFRNPGGRPEMSQSQDSYGGRFLPLLPRGGHYVQKSNVVSNYPAINEPYSFLPLLPIGKSPETYRAGSAEHAYHK